MTATINLTEFLFIDSKVADKQTLIKNTAANIKIVELNNQTDALTQIATALQDQTNLNAIHIISHGSEGELDFANGKLNSANLSTYAMQLKKIGASLSKDGDILLYGCDVSKGDDGSMFINSLSKLTQADVAASDDLTGSTSLGGDWVLEKHTGSIEVSHLKSPSYANLLTAPITSSLPDILFMDGGGAIPIDNAATLNGGTLYGGGSLRFSLENANSADQLVLTSNDSAVYTGAISIVNGIVYLGNGTTTNAIGNLDAIENGINGNPLKIHLNGLLTTSVLNSGFESNDATDWSIGDQQVVLGVTTIGGWASPADTIFPDVNSVAINQNTPTSSNFSHSVVTNDGSNSPNSGGTGGSHSLRLVSSMTTAFGYDVVNGPYALSNTFSATEGNVLYFDWKAAGGSDAYDAFGYLLNTNDGSSTIVLNQTGASATSSTNWATASVEVPTTGNYAFVFVSGTWDASGGKAAGGSLYFDNFKVLDDGCLTDTVAQSIVRQITYQNTANNNVSSSRALTLTVTDRNNNQTNTVANLNIAINAAPTLTDFSIMTGGSEDNAKTVTFSDLETAGNEVDDNAVTGFVVKSVTSGELIIGGIAYNSDTNNTIDADHSASWTPIANRSGILSAFTAVAKDGGTLESTTPIQVNVNFTAVNDIAFSISGTTVGSVTEDELSNVNGTLSVYDIDNVGFIPQNDVHGNYGIFNLNNNGYWNYFLTNDADNVQALVSGEQQKDRFTVYSADGTATSSIVININGTDEPIIDDFDGVANSVEEQITSGSSVSSDGNGDGVKDTEQANVISLPTNKNQSEFSTAPVFLSIAVPVSQTLTEATVTNVKALSTLTFETETFNAKGKTVVVKSPVTLEQAPFGLFSFKLDGIASSHDSMGKTVGGTSEIKLYLDGNQNIDKYLIKTVSGNYEIVPFKATFDSKLKKTVINLSITDGDKFDLDGKVNGTIDDFGTPILKIASINSLVDGILTIDGTAKQANVLHADNALIDLNGLGTFNYQWLANGNVIDKATTDSYTLTQQEVGKILSVRASYTDSDGFYETVTSEVSSIVANINDTPTGVISVNGIAKQGKTLTVSTNKLSDMDGLGIMSYQWFANGKTIKGATSDNYILTQNDVSKKITISASYIDGFGTKESVKSLATAQVENVNDSPKGHVKITLSLQDTDIVMASQNLSDVDGLGSIKHQWMSGDTILAKAKGLYAIANKDIGKWISVTAQYSDKLGTNESVNSDFLYVNALGSKKDDVLAGSENNDYMSGKIGNDSLQGGDGNDILKGNQGNDTLLGGDGDDQLCGGFGRDVLTGGSGHDSFYLGLEKSIITDFNPKDDLLLLDRNVFKVLKMLGQLTPDIFSTYFSYESGELFYDQDASGSDAPIVIAEIGINLNLTAANFSVFASQGLITI